MVNHFRLLVIGQFEVEPETASVVSNCTVGLFGDTVTSYEVA